MEEETKHQKVFGLVCRLVQAKMELENAKTLVALKEATIDKILEELKLIVLKS